jgi:hypothetical protein
MARTPMRESFSMLHPPPRSIRESLALAPSLITLLSDRGSWLDAALPEPIAALWQRGHAMR